jgi:hypothetical protein
VEKTWTLSWTKEAQLLITINKLFIKEERLKMENPSKLRHSLFQLLLNQILIW